MRDLHLILALLACVSLCVEVSTEDELKSVVVILRHGARAARAKIPEFDSRVSWPNGKNELTPSGQRQLHLLGRMMRKYLIEEKSLVSRRYNPNETMVRADSSDRTMMSAQSFALGFYPDLLPQLSAEQLKDESIWVPPVNLTFPASVKKTLNSSALPFDVPVVPILGYNTKYEKLLSLSSCDLFYYYRDQYYNGSLFQEVYKKYNATFQKVCGIVGIDCTKLDRKPVWNYVDGIVTAEFDGQLPVLSPYPDLVDQMERFYTDMEYGELTHVPIMTNIAMHDFSKSIPDYLGEVISNPATPHKLTILSSHESTMLSYLFGLEVKKSIYDTVPYSSVMVIELRKKLGARDGDENAYYVNMTLNGDRIFNLTGFAEFKTWLGKKGKLPGKWKDVCALPGEEKVTLSATEQEPDLVGIAVLVLLVAAVLIILIFGARWLKVKRTRFEEIETMQV